MGFFNSFFKKASKSIAKEIVTDLNKTPRQKEVENYEDGLGIKLDPNSFQTFSDDEYQDYVDLQRQTEQKMFDRLEQDGQTIINRVWNYQDDYIRGIIGKGDLTREIEYGYEDLKTDILSSSSSDPNGILSTHEKMELYLSKKSHLDYLYHQWLPNH